MSMEDELFHHFRPDERMFVERVLDWTSRAEERYQSVLTPFLNPREQRIVDMLVRRSPDLHVTFDGGFSNAERRRARIAPQYMDEEDFGLAFFMVSSLSPDGKLKHPDVLGSLLGLGMKRDKIGDLLSHADGYQIIIASDMADYIPLQLTHVGKLTIRISEMDRNQLISPIIETTEMSISVVSMRLDAVASDAFRISRSKVVTLIKNGRCQVNWKTTENPAEPVKEGDVLSLRGSGRTKVGEIQGRSKKGRLLVSLIRYK
ncbi:RNA-binding protein YlmH, contains S4-like domain [Marininema mesophilum]|uniref:RNA-binding protein YlmH, contains S4-like domain n=1 Tax=Marininema mesophilum TaxID=1048340 RepID=A0A1H2QCN5_9BACL|nr:YlmH/Sll1252 family protein [Marininema mesophilum]SDW04845.1 RNA-binding protein YlmH, contains S4-like domain [Marininema mesophilum]